MGEPDACLTETDGPILAIPPGPICARCFHPPCPCCPSPWCDRLQPGCCEFVCQISVGDYALWQDECEAAGLDEVDGNGDFAILSQAIGPWMPVSVRIDRGLLRAP